MAGWDSQYTGYYAVYCNGIPVVRRLCLRINAADDIGGSSAWREKVAAASPEVLANGGSCVAGPDGEWVVTPSPGEENLLLATIDLRRVFEERQNFDPSGHYSRPDVTRLDVNRKRQGLLGILSD